MENSPNWLELPPELTSSILSRLGTIEILMSVRKVCRSWRRICSDPAMWRIVDLRHSAQHIHPSAMENVIKKAVDLSCGQMMELHLVLLCSHDSLIRYISDRLSSLKYLYIDFFKITGEGLWEVITKLPMLEELHLVSGCDFNKVIEVAGRCCPKLRSLKLIATFYSYQITGSDEDALAIAKNMPGLHHLQLFGHNGITRDGLLAITDSCPHLESLDVLLGLPKVEPELVGRLSQKIRHLMMTTFPSFTGIYQHNLYIPLHINPFSLIFFLITLHITCDQTMRFERGVAVEVASKQVGFVGSFYEAKVIKQLENSKYIVQYLNLVEDEDSRIPLREIVDEDELRLVPPKIPAMGFEFGEMVDAFSRDGWWVGQITGVCEGKYVVHFEKYPKKEYRYSASRLRVHQDWINGKYWLASLYK